MLLENKKSTVVFSQKWHKGIVGIVASRLIEKCYRPTIVFAEENGVLTGSARSVHDFNIYEAISKCSYLCENFGGHKYAAGLTIKKEKINDFINAFERVVSEKITTDQLTPKIKADFELNINDIDEKLFRIIKQFAPFGVSNPSPLFISKGVVKSGSARNIGGDGLHIKFSVKSKHRTLPTIGFGMGSLFQKINDCTSLDICYSINENEWNGRKIFN